MEDNKKIEIKLCDGVNIGALGNPTVFSPERGTMIIDSETHLFLLQLLEAGSLFYKHLNTDTLESFLLLESSGILKINNQNEKLHVSTQIYYPSITDLVLRRDIKCFSSLLHRIASILIHFWGGWFVNIGVILDVLILIYWLLFFKTDISLVWIKHIYICLLILIPVSTVRLVLHEAGHFTAALTCGVSPSAGLGIYYTGPVAYVDLTPLDTQSKRIRLFADLAGISLDGYVIAFLSIIAFVLNSQFLYSIVVLISMACFSSFRLTEKSDVYWFIRDIMDARSITATWGTPVKFYRSWQTQPEARKFLSTLLLVYIILGFFTIVAFVRWTLGLYNSISNLYYSDFIPALSVGIIFLLWFLFLLIYTSRKRVIKL